MGAAPKLSDQVHAPRTQEKRSAAALEAALLRAADGDRRTHEFLATLAHELRNQLGPAMNSVEVMKWASADPGTLDRARVITERQLFHLKRLVDDLLEVSRIGCHQFELRKTRVDLGAVIEQVLEASRPAFQAAGRMLAISPAPGPVWVEADPIRLAQVFGNLLTNARKYTDPGGRVDVVVLRQGSDAVVRIADDGIGIPPGLLARVFERFVQGDRTGERAQGGLGIGLALARELVGLHRGTITAHSEGLGRGSQFIVRLPLLPSPALTAS